MKKLLKSIETRLLTLNRFHMVQLTGILICVGFLILRFEFHQDYPFGTADGKEMFLVAQDPFSRNEDIGWHRYIRILMPLTAYLSSSLVLLILGSLSRKTVTMYMIGIVNLVAYLWATDAAKKTFQDIDNKFLFFTLFSLNPIVLITVIRGLTEPLFYAFSLSMLNSAKRNENSVVIFALGVSLTRPDYGLFLVPFMIYEIYKKREIKFLLSMLILLSIPVLLLFFFVHFFLDVGFQEITENTESNTSFIPFSGWINGIKEYYSLFDTTLVVIFLIIVCLTYAFFLRDLWKRRPLSSTDVFSLCLIAPIIFSAPIAFASYTSHNGRMASGAPSLYLLLQRIGERRYLKISEYTLQLIILYFVISFILVRVYVI